MGVTPSLVILRREIAVIHAEVVVDLYVLPVQLPGSAVEVVHRVPAAQHHHVRSQGHPLGLAGAHDVRMCAPWHLVWRHCTAILGAQCVVIFNQGTMCLAMLHRIAQSVTGLAGLMMHACSHDGVLYGNTGYNCPS